VTAPELLSAARSRVERALDQVLPAEDEPPRRLAQAMRYSVFAGGKRLRPAFLFAAAELGAAPPQPLAAASAAVELVHTYSLIHDALPAMDDDRLRRGKPTCHVVFGEAIAILAGDALLTLAFEVLSRPMASLEATPRLAAIERLARAAGVSGLVGGQSADLGDLPDLLDDEARARAVELIHRRKTGALLGAAIAIGAIVAGLEPKLVARLEQFGEQIGTAFQIADDLLDVESTPAELGKATGKDAAAGKLTYPVVFGLDRSRSEALGRIERAIADIADLGPAASSLRSLARYVIERKC